MVILIIALYKWALVFSFEINIFGCVNPW